MAFFSYFNGNAGKFAKSDKTDPEMAKKVKFWPFLAFEGRFGGLKDSWRCKLSMKLVKLLMGHILKAFRAKKIGPGWQGGSETNFGVGA